MDRVAMQQVDGQAILLHVDSGRYYTLDEVSARVWELCDGNHSVSGIAAALCLEYEAPVDVVEKDVLGFLEAMAAEHLLILR